MKHVIVISFSVLLPAAGIHSVYAQNVGIGQANPGSKLEIRGDGTTSSSSALNVTDTNSNSILLVRDDQKVGIRNSSPDASAVLDIQATDAGVLVPRLTDTQMNGVANPATGLLVYNSDQNKFYYYDGTQWVALAGGNNTSSSGDPTLVYTVDGF